jgi:hypothetical protein
MAKRELIDRSNLEITPIATDDYGGNKVVAAVLLEDVEKAHVITEQEIIKPYIEKLKADVEALNAINLDLAAENEDLVERIGKLIGYIDFLRNTAQGKKKSLNLLEKVVKGELEEIRAEGENFVKLRTGYIPIDDVMSVFDDFMCGEVDEEGTETFLEMLKDKAESEEK